MHTCILAAMEFMVIRLIYIGICLYKAMLLKFCWDYPGSLAMSGDVIGDNWSLAQESGN